MLAVAGRSPALITWDQGMAEQLPYPSGSFDRVLCQFGLMFFDDRERALAEMARVLAPGGRVAIATWCAVEESPGYATMVDLLRRIVDEPAAQALLAPFSLGTVAAVRALIAPVFPEVRVRRHAGTAAFASIEEWLHTDIRGWTLADRIDDATYARLLAAARDALDGYASEDGVRFAAPALIASATGTHWRQPASAGPAG